MFCTVFNYWYNKISDITYKFTLSHGPHYIEFPLYRVFCTLCYVQWNLVIKRSDITKPSYNKVILLVPALYISSFFYPDIMRNLIQQGNFHGPKDLVIMRFHCISFPFYYCISSCYKLVCCGYREDKHIWLHCVYARYTHTHNYQYTLMSHTCIHTHRCRFFFHRWGMICVWTLR